MKNMIFAAILLCLGMFALPAMAFDAVTDFGVQQVDIGKSQVIDVAVASECVNISEADQKQERMYNLIARTFDTAQGFKANEYQHITDNRPLKPPVSS